MRVAVKICGLTNAADARAATVLGAWALGFIFFEKSPRFITPEKTREIILSLQSSAHKVGVVVNASVERLKYIISVSSVDTIQFHGDETPEFCLETTKLFPNIKFIKAIRPVNVLDVIELREFTTCEAFLIDSYKEGQWGGTGLLTNMTLAKNAKEFGPIILSGGLTPLNVVSQVSKVNPMAVDVSSGIESSPGVKCHEKMKAFFESMRSIR